MPGARSPRKYIKLLDFCIIFFLSAVLVRPLFKAKYLDLWPSIESTFIATARFWAAHWPHPLWQPLWYCGTRFDYIYPPLLQFGTTLLSAIYIPAEAYHVFTAFLFCLGIAGIYFMVRTMGSSRAQGWISAAACALISPSFLFLPDVRHFAPYLVPQRLGLLIRWGEGPHVSAVALIPYALGFAFLGMQRRRFGFLALAGIFCALVPLTNFYGATGLAILYPILAWSMWVVYREFAIWLRALAIPLLAYGLAAFWLTPSYFRLTLNDLRYVSQAGNWHSTLLLLIAAAVFIEASLFWSKGQPPRAQSVYFVFVTGGLLFMTLNVLGNHYFNFRIIGEPIRLVHELDTAIVLAVIEILRRLWNQSFQSHLATRVSRGAVLVTALAACFAAFDFIPHAWELYPKEPDYRRRVEFRMPEWMTTHMPDSRTLVVGSVRFWWDTWHDLAEVEGGSDQGQINPNIPAAGWEFSLGKDPELSVRWLQSLGADAVIVSDSHSEEIYHDFKFPYKFAGVLPVLFDDHQGNVIYRVPRRYPGIARVVDTAQSQTARPIEAANYLPPLRAYANMVESGPDSPATTHWNGTDSVTVHASLRNGQSLLLQETYDPSWHAYAGNRELPIRKDVMDFMAIDESPGDSDIVFKFEEPLENRIGHIVSEFSLLLCACLGFVAWKTGPLPLSPETSSEPLHPFYFRILRALLRELNRRSRSWPAIPEKTPFDADRLRSAEAALKTLPVSDANGQTYLDRHIPRLARTLALAPPPQSTGRVLELGCYMQLTPFLQTLGGYREVRGAYFGQAGKIDHKVCELPGGQFSCYVDHFDVERDPFPYPDDYFDLIVAAEIIEHLTYDPMEMLLEARRTLIDGGYLLLTTPNIGSVTSVAKTLHGQDNPQIYYVYDRPGPGRQPEIGHMREYTLHELGEAARAAGFEIELLTTTAIEEYATHRSLLHFLALNGFDIENRGEQSWCLARKRAALPVNRFPDFLYGP